jgi:hypothetical protein
LYIRFAAKEKKEVKEGNKMRISNWFLTLAVIVLVSFALVGCYTRFGLVHQEPGYDDSEGISEVEETEESEQIEEDDALPCCDDIHHYDIHSRYFYDPWCWEPGFYVSIGFGWNYFDPYAYYPYWYYPYYYYPYVAYPYPWIYPPAYPVYYYEPGYYYAYNYERRPFIKRSQYLPARRGMNLNERMELASRSSRRVEIEDRNRYHGTTGDFATAGSGSRTDDGSSTSRRTKSVKIREKVNSNPEKNYGKDTQGRREVITSGKENSRNKTTDRGRKEVASSTKENSGKRETVKRGESRDSGNAADARSSNSNSNTSQPKVSRSDSDSNNNSSGSGRNNSTVTRSSSESSKSSSGSADHSYSAPSSSHSSSSSSGSHSVARSSSSSSSSGSSKSSSSGSGGRRR